MSGALDVPRFEPGELLTARRLEEEQEAHRDASRRHRRLTHTPGVLAGLRVTGGGGAEAESVDPLVLQPGYAVDDFGRELLVPGPVALDARLDAEVGLRPLAEAFVLALYLEQRPRPGVEIVEVVVELIPPERTPKPPTVTPERFPDAHAEPAPRLVVGTLKRAGAHWRFTADGRREAGVVAASVHRGVGAAPWLRLTDDADGADTRLECLLPWPPGTTATDEPTIALTLGRAGAELPGTTRFTDAVEVDGALAFAGPPPGGVTPAEDDAAAAPVFSRRLSDGTDELQLRLASPDARFVVAAPPKPGAEPAPLLEITGDGGVVVYGDLVVEGSVIEGPQGPPVDEGGEESGEGGENGGEKPEQAEGPLNRLMQILSVIPTNSAPFLLGFLVGLGVMVAFPETARDIAAVIAEQRQGDGAGE